MDLGVSTPVEITRNGELELTLDSITLLPRFLFFFFQGRTKNRRSNFLSKKDKSILLNSNLPTDSKMPGASRANQFH